jgi:hypothetical protein
MNMKGYKVFNSDWTCRDFKYEVGKTYKQEGEIEICNKGFHFCEVANDCFNYYGFDSNNKVAEVFAHGKVENDGDKSVTNEIEIVREISWYELLTLVNTGKGNTGRRNTGNGNTGNGNSGYRNSGNGNSGDRNSGNGNTGNGNGGYRNSGNGNSGNGNSGYGNSGYGNSGYRNTGNWNTGDFNVSNNNSGCFNTVQHNIKFFDKESKLTFSQWRGSHAFYLLSKVNISPVQWIKDSEMTEEEKKQNPSYKTTGGYLKKCDTTKAYQEWWEDLNDKERDTIRAIPNFDAKKFEMITGVDTTKQKKINFMRRIMRLEIFFEKSLQDVILKKMKHL